MAYFAHVELHGADWPRDYEELRDRLMENGFANYIPTSGGANLRLPAGLFYTDREAYEDADVSQLVKDCADSSGFTNEVVVVKDGGSLLYLTRQC